MVKECAILSYGLGSFPLNMNKLVEYLAEHYHPSGNAFKIALATELIERSGFTEEEVHEMALMAYREEMILIGRLRVKGNRWGVDVMIPDDIDNMAIKRKGLKWIKLNKTRIKASISLSV